MQKAITNPVPSRPTRPLTTIVPILTLWFLAASWIAVTGVLTRARPLVPLSIAAIVLASVVTYRRSSALRAHIDAIDVRGWAAFHALRAPIGAAMLFDWSRGLLPELFATRAGYGDMVAGIVALAFVFVDPVKTQTRRRAFFWWNVFGALDIGLAFFTAQYQLVFQRDPLMLEAITRLPYALLPTFIVPLVVTTHVLMLRRFRPGGRGTVSDD